MSRKHRLALTLGLLGALFSAACDDDAGSGGTDAAVDAGVSDAGVDATPDGGPQSPCRTPVATGLIVDIDPAGPDSQIHADAIFDGEAIWVVYNLPDPAGGFDVWALRLHCDGTHDVPPFRVNTTDENDVDPAVALGPGALYIAWASDNGTGIDNMDVVYRTYDRDGVAIMASDRILETLYLGQPVTGNQLGPDVAALPGGGFAIAGARALSGIPSFQFFVQELTDAGDPVGAARASIDASSSEMNPTLVSVADGTLYPAYTHSVGFTDDEVRHARFAPGAAVPDPDPPTAAIDGVRGDGASYAFHAPEDRLYLAFGTDDGRILLTDGAIFGPAPELELGGAGQLDHTPIVAPRDGGGAVVWFQNIAGFQNALRAQPFAYDGQTFVPGAAVNVTIETVAPYAPAATHLGDDLWFVAWSEGTSPGFRLRGRFLQLP